MGIAYYAGIDLGTMHTAVAGSNGIRRVTASAVGRPKDALAQKLLGKDLFFGEELARHQQSLVVQRPFECGHLKYGDWDSLDSADAVRASFESARALLQHAVGLLEFPPSAKLCCVLGAPAQATLKNKRALLSIAESVAECVLLVSEPFVVGFSLESPLAPALIVDIGAGTTDVCFYYGAFPNANDQITIAYGGDHVDRDFQERVAAEFPEALFSLGTARRVKEKCGFVGSTDQPVQVRLPVRQGPPQVFDLTSPLEQACRKLADQVVQGLLAVVSQIDYEQHASVLSNIVLSGGGGQLRGLDKYIESTLREYGHINVTRLYDSAFAGANGALRLAMHLPETMWQSLKQETTASVVDGLRRSAA